MSGAVAARPPRADWSGSPVAEIEVSLRGKDWELFTETHVPRLRLLLVDDLEYARLAPEIEGFVAEAS